MISKPWPLRSGWLEIEVMQTPLDLRFETFARAPQGRRNCAVPRQQPNLDLNSDGRGAEVVAIAAAGGQLTDERSSLTRRTLHTRWSGKG
jgi:hypothetical protein